MSNKLTLEENGNIKNYFLIWFVQNCITNTLSGICYCYDTFGTLMVEKALSIKFKHKMQILLQYTHTCTLRPTAENI
jgi:hypothetical protein